MTTVLPFLLKVSDLFPMAAERIYHKPESLKTTEIYYLKLFEARSPGSMYQKDWFFLEALKDCLFHACILCWWPAILGIPCVVAA